MMIAKNNKTSRRSEAGASHGSTREPSLTVWPSGDVSIGFFDPDREDDKRGRSPQFIDSVSLEKKQLLPISDKEIEEYGEFALALDAEGRTQEAIAVLDFISRRMREHTGLSDALISHKQAVDSLKAAQIRERKPRGSGGITSFGKKSLKSAAVVIASRWSRKLLTFATCTLPAMTRSELEAICDGWPEITRKFQQELRRELKRKKLPLDYCGCSEIQPKRWERNNTIAPHLHFCFVGRKHGKGKWLINHEWIRDTWKRILENFLGREVYADAATEARGVEKSLANEIGKYLSKGGQVIREIEKAGRGAELPRAYWNIPLKLRQEIKDKTFRDRGITAQLWLNHWKQICDSGKASLRPVLVSRAGYEGLPYGNFLGGFSGWIRADSGWDLLGVTPDQFLERLKT